MKSFRAEVPVRFAHCDPAGIVFYPRYFEMLSAIVEDWLAQVLGTSVPTMADTRRMLAPTAALDVTFPCASRFGDTLTFECGVEAIGRSSCTLAVTATCGGETRLTVRQVLVFVSADLLEPTPIPDDMRRRMVEYCATPAVSVEDR
jgi:4-hydroxybenzoyl-CoA thioesterase